MELGGDLEASPIINPIGAIIQVQLNHRIAISMTSFGLGINGAFTRLSIDDHNRGLSPLD